MGVSTEELDKMAVVYTAKKKYTLDMSDGKVKKIIIMNFSYNERVYLYSVDVRVIKLDVTISFLKK